MNHPITKIQNLTGYTHHRANMGPDLEGTPNNHKRHKLEVIFILDMVPGAFNQPQDLMRWIATNPYVDTVTLVEGAS